MGEFSFSFIFCLPLSSPRFFCLCHPLYLPRSALIFFHADAVVIVMCFVVRVKTSSGFTEFFFFLLSYCIIDCHFICVSILSLFMDDRFFSFIELSIYTQNKRDRKREREEWVKRRGNFYEHCHQFTLPTLQAFSQKDYSEFIKSKSTSLCI